MNIILIGIYQNVLLEVLQEWWWTMLPVRGMPK